jgi:hypothetical protein
VAGTHPAPHAFDGRSTAIVTVRVATGSGAVATAVEGQPAGFLAERPALVAGALTPRRRCVFAPPVAFSTSAAPLRLADASGTNVVHIDLRASA